MTIRNGRNGHGRMGMLKGTGAEQLISYRTLPLLIPVPGQMKGELDIRHRGNGSEHPGGHFKLNPRCPVPFCAVNAPLDLSGGLLRCVVFALCDVWASRLGEFS